MLSRTLFHHSVTAWFEEHFLAPTPAQAEAWPLIKAGRNVLIAAPTGSGKTLAAFMAAIDDLVRQGIDGRLTDETQILSAGISRLRSPVSGSSFVTMGNRMSTSGPGCGPEIRRPASASAWSAARPTSS
jgi:hypothetical protein